MEGLPPAFCFGTLVGPCLFRCSEASTRTLKARGGGAARQSVFRVLFWTPVSGRSGFDCWCPTALDSQKIQICLAPKWAFGECFSVADGFPFSVPWVLLLDHPKNVCVCVCVPLFSGDRPKSFWFLFDTPNRERFPLVLRFDFFSKSRCKGARFHCLTSMSPFSQAPSVPSRLQSNERRPVSAPSSSRVPPKNGGVQTNQKEYAQKRTYPFQPVVYPRDCVPLVLNMVPNVSWTGDLAGTLRQSQC